MPSTQSAAQLLKGYLVDWHQDLQRWSENGRLLAAAQEALMLEGTPRRLQHLIDQWGSGDFSSIPEIVLLSAADMNGAMGAYAISTGKIYLNKDWLLTAGSDAVGAVLTEELGHHLDAELNESDTQGDEGEVLSAYLYRQEGNRSSIISILEGDDNTTIAIVGSDLELETSFSGRILETTILSEELSGTRPDGRNVWDEVILDDSGFWVAEGGVAVDASRYRIDLVRMSYDAQASSYSIDVIPSQLQEYYHNGTNPSKGLIPYSWWQTSASTRYIHFEERSKWSNPESQTRNDLMFPIVTVDVERLLAQLPSVLQIGSVQGIGGLDITHTFFNNISSGVKSSGSLGQPDIYTFYTSTMRRLDPGVQGYQGYIDLWEVNLADPRSPVLAWSEQLSSHTEAKVQEDPQGNLYVSISASEYTSINNLNDNTVEARKYNKELSANGGLVLAWSTTIELADSYGLGGGGRDGPKISKDGNTVYLTEEYQSNVGYGKWLVAFNALSGECLWQTQIPGMFDFDEIDNGTRLVVTSNTAILIIDKATGAIIESVLQPNNGLEGDVLISTHTDAANNIIFSGNRMDLNAGRKAVYRYIQTEPAQSIAMSNTAAELDISGSQVASVNGNKLGNMIIGNGLNNTINPGAGDDNVTAGDGADLLIGGSGQGNDKYDGGAGADTLRYTSATFGVVVNLRLGTATDSTAGKQPTTNPLLRIDDDLIINVENIETGIGDDDVTGNSKNNLFIDQSTSDVDTVRLTGKFSDYVMSYVGSSVVTVADKRLPVDANSDGEDTYTNYERFIFSDGIYRWNVAKTALEMQIDPPAQGATKSSIGNYDFTITGTPASGKVVATQKVTVGRKTSTETKINETFTNVQTVEITAGASANILNAQAWTGDSKLKGEGGNDTLTGGSGITTYTGGLGADKFRFVVKPEFTAALADHITHFLATEKDKIEISRTGFGIAKTAKVSIATVNGSVARVAALAKTSLFVYDSSTGELWWNQNGSTAGAGTGGVFAILDNKPASLSTSSIGLV